MLRPQVASHPSRASHVVGSALLCPNVRSKQASLLLLFHLLLLPRPQLTLLASEKTFDIDVASWAWDLSRFLVGSVFSDRLPEIPER